MEPRGIGLLLAFLAGMATAVGAGVVFLLRDFTAPPYAMCMAASAGVMVYISLVELFATSIEKYGEVYSAQGHAEGLATLSFFGGWCSLWLFDWASHWMLEAAQRRDLNHRGQYAPKAAADEHPLNDFSRIGTGHEFSTEVPPSKACEPASARTLVLKFGDSNAPNAAVVAHTDSIPTSFIKSSKRETVKSSEICPCCIAWSEGIAKRNSAGEEYAQIFCCQQRSAVEVRCNDLNGEDVAKAPSEETKKNGFFGKFLCRRVPTVDEQAEIDEANRKFAKAQTGLLRVGIFTAIALTVHNFPEGLATFTSSLADTAFGAGVAVAVGVHNIPEGFAVAVPIYYATGSRWKGFILGSLSGKSSTPEFKNINVLFTGFAEPLAGLLGYFIIGESQDPVLFATMFGVISGIMCNLSLRELLPSAYKYDPTDRVTSICMTLAMAAMATTLVVFKTVGI